jgi:hypothetical protein
MWLRWAVIAVGFVLAVVVMGIFLTGDSECRSWQQSYTVVYEEMANERLNGPIFPSDVIEETERRVGLRPKDCVLPKPITD